MPLIAGWYSCISEYHPDDTGINPEILIVDGVITNGETVIRLSRSIALDETFGANNYVNYATLYIETAGGVRSPKAVMSEGGRYIFSDVALKTDTLYRLRIEVGEDIFVSEYLTPLVTPEIDSLTWKKAGEGEPVNLYVSTTNDNSNSRFYRWTFNEIWEFSAPLYSNGMMDPVVDTLILYDEREGPYNERFFCWLRSNSNQLIVESSVKLSDNVIRNKKFHSIEASNNRLSILYYINVNQYLIRKNTFDYFENLQKNIESMGSIFAPIPSEMNGNIRCLNRDIPAIGYVDVSTHSSKIMYIDRKENLYEQPRRSCEISPVKLSGYLTNFYDPQLGFDYAPADCVDCVRAGGTKNKPAFWPNEHI